MRISDWSSDVCSSDLDREEAGTRIRRDELHADDGTRRQAARPDGHLSRRLPAARRLGQRDPRSEEHTSELQSLMRNSYAVFCLKKKNKSQNTNKRITNK